MARVDDYREAFRLAKDRLKKENLHLRAKLAGADIEMGKDDTLVVSLPYLGTRHRVRVGNEVEVDREGSDPEVRLPDKVLICHYLLNAGGQPASGEKITFRQIPDGHFYFDAFQRRARDPFLKMFGENPELFRRAAAVLGGSPMEHGDVGMAFAVLPRVSVQLVLWLGDDEFPPEASVLFDDNISDYLPIEDIAYISGSLVYTLMGIAAKLQAQENLDGTATDKE